MSGLNLKVEIPQYTKQGKQEKNGVVKFFTVIFLNLFLFHSVKFKVMKYS
jgi:hypothetical protein